MTCSTAVMIRVAPGAPSTSTGRPPHETIVGVIPVVRPLCGAMLFGPPGTGSKLIIELLNMNPSPGEITPEDDPSECVSETQLPARSTTATCVVSFDSIGPRATLIGWPESISARNSAIRSGDSIQ